MVARLAPTRHRVMGLGGGVPREARGTRVRASPWGAARKEFLERQVSNNHFHHQEGKVL